MITTIDGYGEMLWVGLVGAIDKMTDQVNAFQSQAKKLLKSLKDWEAFRVCKNQIDDFLELLPLLTELSAKSMRSRHWQQMMTITGKQLNLAEDQFRLQNLLDCDLLKFADDVLELTTASSKEEAIESKLAEISDEWSDAQFVFVAYKNRGDVLLRAADTAEIIEKLEDTQMVLGSMATNRYSAPFKEEVDSWIIKLSVVSEIIRDLAIRSRVDVHGSSLQWRRHRQAAAAGGQALRVHRQELQQARRTGARDPQRRADVRRQRPAEEHAAAPHGAARAVPEVAQLVPGGQARHLPALLLRVGPDAPRDPVDGQRPAGGAAALPV